MTSDIQEICFDISKYKRDIGSFGAFEVKNYIKNFAQKNGIPINIESFDTKKIPTKLELYVGNRIELNILTNIQKDIQGKLIILDNQKLRHLKTLKDYVCVLKIKNITDLECNKDIINNLSPEGVIFCLEDLDIGICQTLKGYNMPIYSMPSKYLKDITNIESEHIYINHPYSNAVKGENIYFDIGRGPIVYILSSISSREDSFGAIYSACSVAFSINFAKSLLEHYNSDFKFRFFFTEENMFSYDGIYYHVNSSPKYAYYAISLLNIGWSNLNCFYEDADGENSLYLSDKFFNYIKSLNTNITFSKVNTISYLHGYFKNIGVKTMMFGAYPCVISNTVYDNIESVRFDKLDLWFKVLSGFLRRLHAI